MIVSIVRSSGQKAPECENEVILLNIRELVAGKTGCACGREHTCPISYVFIENGALSHLPEICREYSHIVLVADGNTFPLCGEEAQTLLGEKIASRMIFGKDVVVPNEDSIARIEAVMDEKTDLLLGIGSGVINDLCKYVSFFHGLRYVMIATAPSMDGYASVGAAMILHEMKITVNARPPMAILGDGAILRTAPMDMIRSGYGDIVGKYSCLNDWKLAALLRGEYFCQYVYDTVMETVRAVEGLAPRLLARDPDAVSVLTQGLVTVGILMAYVGNSRPASGSEHHLSHFFEITGLLDKAGYYLHGIDVLYGAAVTAKLREELLALDPPFGDFRFDRAAWEKKIREVYTTAADGVIALQDKTGFYASESPALFAARWAEIKSVLAEAPGFEQMDGYLRAIGLDYGAFRQFYGTERIENAIRWAKDLKDRYTVLWLYYVLVAANQ